MLIEDRRRTTRSTFQVEEETVFLEASPIMNGRKTQLRVKVPTSSTSGTGTVQQHGPADLRVGITASLPISTKLAGASTMS
jgi:hypothetical protein